MDREQIIKNVEKNWPKKKGKADYIHHLRGKRLTQAAAIRAKCYECVQGEDTQPCTVATCALAQYCQWNKRGESTPEDAD
ncbi:hypothetical protein AOG1_16180 [Geobacter sp. AOG1]|nr:hypothetical protein AOG1_16180 [Geobacter sp. AOG1]